MTSLCLTTINICPEVSSTWLHPFSVFLSAYCSKISVGYVRLSIKNLQENLHWCSTRNPSINMPPSFLIRDILNLLNSLPIASDGVTGISNQQLVEWSTAYLNILCKGFPKQIALQVKKRRRTLKNRNYTSSSRFRKAKVLDELKLEVLKLQEEIVLLKNKLNSYYCDNDRVATTVPSNC